MSQVNKMNKFQAITLNIKVDPFSSETENKWLKFAKIVKNLSNGENLDTGIVRRTWSKFVLLWKLLKAS